MTKLIWEALGGFPRWWLVLSARVSFFFLLLCDGHRVQHFQGTWKMHFLLFFFVDGDTLQSCFIFKAAWCFEWGSFLLHQQRGWCTKLVSLKHKEGNHRKMKAWDGGGLRRKGVCFRKNCAFLSFETAGNYFGVFWKILHSESSLKVAYLYFASILEDACGGGGEGFCKFSSLLISLLATLFFF